MNNGVRSDGADYFDDVLEAEENAGSGGILDSAGLRGYDKVKTSVKLKGPQVRMDCRNCGNTRDVNLEWPEIMQVAGNMQGADPILPQGWKYSPINHTAYTTLRCPACGKDGFSVHVTPEEAQLHVKQGIAAGFVDGRQAQAIQQRVVAMQQQAMQARGYR